MGPYKNMMLGVASVGVLVAGVVIVAFEGRDSTRRQAMAASYQLDDTWRGHRAHQPVYLPVDMRDGVKLQMETFSGPEANNLTLHVSERVTTQSIESWEGAEAKGLTGEASQPPLVKDIFAIPGVAQVCLYPYEIHVVKGRLYSWDDMSPALSAVIFKHLGRKSSGGPVMPKPIMKW